ncbi:MAG: MarR family transcriptional regulator [Dehalococcoidia bacterium]|jgi:DNA-binding MarR family transcriptional regulator|nr:MAG: MarR family transcriptional regulator [Dehalococcoidia bacterium]
MPPIPRDVFNESLHLLSAVNRSLYEARNDELRPLGITSQQSAMLHQIKSLGDEATVTNVAQRLHRDVSSVSDMLARLEKRGLVRRFIDPGDRRQVYVFLTEKGQEVRDQSQKENSIIKRARSQLGDGEIEELNRILKELYRICLENPKVPESETEVSLR